jgi:predicted amidophosphoribosyltransferase
MAPPIVRFARAAYAAAAELLWPEACLGCASPCGTPLCRLCTAACPVNMGPRCRRCDDAWPPGAASLCARCRRLGATPLAAARGVYLYGGLMARAIVAGKHHGHEGVWPVLAAWVAQDAQAQALLHEAQLLVPIPLHPARRLSRGYNPSSAVARALAAHSPAPLAHLLRRRSGGTPQSLQNAQQRAQGMRDALWARPLPPRLRGATVLLVDDVITTGATLRAGAHALRAAGAGRVLGLAVARQTLDHGTLAPTWL